MGGKSSTAAKGLSREDLDKALREQRERFEKDLREQREQATKAEERYANHLEQMRQDHRKSSERLERAQAQTLASLKNEAQAKQTLLESQLGQVQKTMDKLMEDEMEGRRMAEDLSKKLQQLEKEKEDWKKAEQARIEKAMKEAPPPFAVKKNPPDNTPLLTEEYPCFAILGKSGTGKSSLVNALTGTLARRVSALSETTGFRNELAAKRSKCGREGQVELEPPPEFLELPEGTTVALFDRPGVGAAIGAGPEFIKKQGLRYWSGVIIVVDRSAGTEEVKIHAVCAEVGTPVVVVRNKISYDLQEEKEICDKTGDPFDEEEALQVIRNYLDQTGLDGKSALMIDTKHRDKYEFKSLLGWMQKHSKATQD